MNINFTINIDDRIINFWKRTLTKKKMAVTLGITVFATSLIVYGASVVEVPNEFFPGDTISSSQVNQNFTVLQNKVNELISEIEAINTAEIPAGTIVPFAGPSINKEGESNIPEGWLLCDGQEYEKGGKYNDLYKVIDVYHGVYDEDADYFRVPDLRGMFLRGANKIGEIGRTDSYKDPDFSTRTWGNVLSENSEGIGSYQDGGLKEHYHHIANTDEAGYGNSSLGTSSGSNYLMRTANMGGIMGDDPATNYFLYGSSTLPNKGRTSKVGDVSSESRPNNIAVHYIIKY